jgi:uncharacterized protein
VSRLSPEPMPMKRLFNLLPALLVVALTGCASAPSRFYNLTSTARSDGAPSAKYAVVVGPVSVPSAVDRPQFTIELSPNRVEFEEFNRWAAPLSEGIGRVISRDLGVLLGTTLVATSPSQDLGPSYRVAINVDQFDSVLGSATASGKVRLTAVWAVRGPSGDLVGSGATSVQEEAAGKSYDALAAAHSRALGKVSADIAGCIRGAAAKP